jgi:hypothetical protein
LFIVIFLTITARPLTAATTLRDLISRVSSRFMTASTTSWRSMISPSTIASASGAEMPQRVSLCVRLGCDSSSTALIVWLPMSSPTRDCFLPKSMGFTP